MAGLAGSPGGLASGPGEGPFRPRLAATVFCVARGSRRDARPTQRGARDARGTSRRRERVCGRNKERRANAHHSPQSLRACIGDGLRDDDGRGPGLQRWRSRHPQQGRYGAKTSLAVARFDPRCARSHRPSRRSDDRRRPSGGGGSHGRHPSNGRVKGVAVALSIVSLHRPRNRRRMPRGNAGYARGGLRSPMDLLRRPIWAWIAMGGLHFAGGFFPRRSPNRRAPRRPRSLRRGTGRRHRRGQRRAKPPRASGRSDLRRRARA